MFYHDFYNVDPFKPTSMEFNMFSSEEVKKLSVARIDSLISFTPLGEPVQGGLYDPRLGPIHMNSGKCTTCNQNSVSCSGHFGHIELPCPVINPIFNTAVIHILKISCLSCYCVLLPRETTILLAAQLKLIDNGQLTYAYDLATEINGLCEDDERKLSVDELETFINLYLKERLQENNGSYVKSADEIRQTFIAETLNLVARRSGCMHCKQPLSTISKSYSTITISHAVKSKKEKKSKEYLFPADIREHMRQLWIKEKHFISALLPVLAGLKIEHPTDVCFMSEILVTPSNIRPNLMVKGKLVESPRNSTYKSILREAKVIQYIWLLQDQKEGQEISSEITELVNESQGKDSIEKVQIGMHNLQMCVDALLDGNLFKSYNSKDQSTRIGLKQLLEKKSGIIRQNMMGKRVDYFARSVITPDPYLDTDEIGIPVEFAKKLTYPVAVTDWNNKGLHGVVLNGPNHYPGANMIETDEGIVKWLSATNKSRREALSKTLFYKGPNSRGPQIVHRHVIDGDMMLVNRQPSLHKPSIMAHRVKVLKGEKTLRLHYANCKAYNADFDGDEMNAHLPQSELAKCEAKELASAVYQYLVPRDGTPLSGLIQDHIISSVRMTVRGHFFTRREYMHFVYQALSSFDCAIKTVPPAIIKPVMLWSGKQIISTLIINLTPLNQKTYINLKSKSKLEQKFWRNPNNYEYPDLLSEFNFIVQNGNLLSGILDKNHIGASTYSLVHCFYELYGGKYSAQLLSAFSKLFTVYLQCDAFTLGVEDILVTEKADHLRQIAIDESKTAGTLAAQESLGIEYMDEDAMNIKLAESYSKSSHFPVVVDRNYKKHLQPFTNKITRACIPKGLLQPFPNNNLQLMVQSGAKGSTVNTIQISCCLGQIELEGKRPPMMISGRTLPSFPPFDTLPKAGGFIGSRFMTGIQPQEFFFHCMAGREGLIDTAVKTSRSGYLQRCLVKHLESLIVNYDMTVRDSNGSIVQYLYGEDGLEVTKSSFFKEKQFDFLAGNVNSFKALKKIRNDECYKELDDKLEEIKSTVENKKKNRRESEFLSWCKQTSKVKNKKHPKIKNGRYVQDLKMCNKWYEMDKDVKMSYTETIRRVPDPVGASFHPGGHYGLLSEKMDSSINRYFDTNNGLNDNDKQIAKESIRLKAMAATAAAGEPVGCIAAQSVGEPSTQMTLNTFHFAGRGEMNVTLGIPRLREILMMATKTIKTPSMEIPFFQSENVQNEADFLRKLMTKISLKDVLSKVKVQEKVMLNPVRRMCYDLTLYLLPHRCYKSMTHVTPKAVMRFIKNTFSESLKKMFIKNLSNNFSGELISEQTKTAFKMSREKNNDNDEDALLDKSEPQETKTKNQVDSDSESEAGEFDSAAMKRKAQTEEYDYEKDEDDPESDEEAEISEKQSECDNLTSTEGQPIKSNHNTSDSEINIEDENSEDFVNKKDYSQIVIDVRCDKKPYTFANIQVSIPLEFKRIDLTGLLKDLMGRVIIHEIPGINRAILTEEEDKIVLKTEGSRGVAELFRFANILDLNSLYCNDIQMMLNTYGIEAANRVIIKEVKNVFKVYGINVDTRHLSLIADYMTYDGKYKALNRVGMNGCPSPLQQMSFESTLNYLKKSTVRGLKDNLVSPSSTLIIGQQAQIGSGLVKLLWQ
ncbi:PREDICTED: DNA-directed RNA polymerase I subunit RPA1 isoform X1 [Diuraphis noxia]|uniref:DNA-directed RNA polymerase I subunit RPA1 isoform X1 n=1 Tax=Diuraphis noxia TaxID=143948 RepID=UPI000763A486|nr:PREDICTED: DNA-directed RNA polymerase I subunit RPA1 isoform X1 [Diuraphis noxia]XP_015379063.1 PREDICTED: DNA-directed RNA polymerase I subunit RPA1 isoform X1 [Diuraphis noxia]